MEHPVEKASVVILLGVTVAYAVVPDRMQMLLAPATTALTRGLRWAHETLPRPVFLVGIFLVVTIVAILIAISFARVFYKLLSNAGPRVTFVYRKLTPSTPKGKVFFFFVVAVAFFIGLTMALPILIGDLTKTETLNNTTQLGDSPGEILSQAEVDALGILQSDAVPPGGEGGSYEGPSYERPTPDADGDRLRDSWERAGRTPGGTRLPNANPQRMDLYVQINYGGGTLPLSSQEKAQLQRVWAAMPVENPDGSQGITLHIDDQRSRGGALGQPAVYFGARREITRFYTRQYLGGRLCRYHQVVVGEVRTDGLGGKANAPGYAAYVDTERKQEYVRLTEQNEFEREVSPRVHVITHELLHNIVGQVDGESHTQSGWLSSTADPRETHLSNTTASAIENDGFAGSGYYQHELCAG